MPDAHRARIEAGFPEATGYLDQEGLEQRLAPYADEKTAQAALDALATGRWILVCGQAFGVTWPSPPDANAPWQRSDSFRLPLRYGRDGTLSIEFADVQGVDEPLMLVLAKGISCAVGRYNGNGKASPSVLVDRVMTP